MPLKVKRNRRGHEDPPGRANLMPRPTQGQAGGDVYRPAKGRTPEVSRSRPAPLWLQTANEAGGELLEVGLAPPQSDVTNEFTEDDRGDPSSRAQPRLEAVVPDPSEAAAVFESDKPVGSLLEKSVKG